LKWGHGGVAAGWFSGMRAIARPARRASAESSVLHYFARSGPTKEAHRRAFYRSDGLLRSVAGRGHARCLRVTLPRGLSNQPKRAAVADHSSPTHKGTIREGLGPARPHG
jgi:hypothetical protein